MYGYRNLSKFFFVAFFLWLTSNIAGGQSNYKAARAVTLNGDTLMGKINDQKWNINPDSFLFIRKSPVDEIIFRPSNVNAIVIDSGDYYLSAQVKIDMNYSRGYDISDTYQDSSGLKQVFLRAIIIGKASLFIYTDVNAKEHFFFKTALQNYKELISKKAPVVINGRTYTTQVETYKEDLKVLMADCKKTEVLIQNTGYYENALLKLFKQYNQCAQSNSVIYESKEKPIPASFHIGGDIHVTSLSFHGADYSTFLQEADFSKSYSPGFFIQSIMYFPRNRGKHSIVTDLQFMQYATEAWYHEFYEYYINFSMTYLKLNVAYRFKYAQRLISPFIGIGGTGAYLLDGSNELNVIGHYSGSTYQYTVSPYLIPDRYDFGWYGDAGINYKKFNMEFRYERRVGFLHTLELSTLIEAMYFLLSYQIS